MFREQQFGMAFTAGALGLSLLSGCVLDARDSVTDQSSADMEALPVIATILREDGSQMEFLDAGGAIVLSANVRDDESISRELEELDPTDVLVAFEQLAGRPAPASLVEAVTRQPDGPPSGSVPPTDPPKLGIEPLLDLKSEESDGSTGALLREISDNYPYRDMFEGWYCDRPGANCQMWVMGRRRTASPPMRLASPKAAAFCYTGYTELEDGRNPEILHVLWQWTNSWGRGYHWKLVDAEFARAGQLSFFRVWTLWPEWFLQEVYDDDRDAVYHRSIYP